MLDEEKMVISFRPDWKRETGNQVALAFECESPAQVDEIYAQATAAGFHGEKEPWDAFWGQRYGQLQDPDGVPVDLYARALANVERGVHDLGGRPIDAPIDRSEHELADWELLTDALVGALGGRGLMNVDELRARDREHVAR